MVYAPKLGVWDTMLWDKEEEIKIFGRESKRNNIRGGFNSYEVCAFFPLVYFILTVLFFPSSFG